MNLMFTRGCVRAAGAIKGANARSPHHHHHHVVVPSLLSTTTISSRRSFMNTPPEEDIAIEKKTGAGIGNVKDQMVPPEEQQFRHTQHPRTVSIIGAPMTYGQPYVGTDSGPRLLRQAGLLSMLSELGWRVEDMADLDFDAIKRNAPPITNSLIMGHAKNFDLVGPGTFALSKVVEEKILQGRFPLILGGDHSIGIGSLAGILRARPNTGVIWVDAHADLHLPSTSESGNMHGMPVGMNMEGVSATSIPSSSVPGFEWLANVPRLPANSLVYVGLRDVDVAERAAIRRLGVKTFTMHEIDRYGIGKTMEMALDHLLRDDPNRPLHLSYDIDAIDPFLAPATGTTVRGGLTFREAHYVAESVAMSGNLASAEMVELNPNLSDGKGAQDTVDLGLQIVTSLMGNSII